MGEVEIASELKSPDPIANGSHSQYVEAPEEVSIYRCWDSRCLSPFYSPVICCVAPRWLSIFSTDLAYDGVAVDSTSEMLIGEKGETKGKGEGEEMLLPVVPSPPAALA